MPFLDVTQPLLDPEFTDSFTVLRRQEVVDSHGRSTLQTTTFAAIIGVVTASSPNDLDRPQDYEVFTRAISIVTKFRMRGEVVGYQPDVVVWRGDNFVVKHIGLYPQFGVGFYQVECESMDRVDNPTDPTLMNRLDFTLNTNSEYAEIICN
jgi:hypothetical protein